MRKWWQQFPTRKGAKKSLLKCDAYKMSHESELKSDCATAARVKRVATLVSDTGLFSRGRAKERPVRCLLAQLDGGSARKATAGLERGSLCSSFREKALVGSAATGAVSAGHASPLGLLPDPGLTWHSPRTSLFLFPQYYIPCQKTSRHTVIRACFSVSFRTVKSK